MNIGKSFFKQNSCIIIFYHIKQTHHHVRVQCTVYIYSVLCTCTVYCIHCVHVQCTMSYSVLCTCTVYMYIVLYISCTCTVYCVHVQCTYTVYCIYIVYMGVINIFITRFADFVFNYYIQCRSCMLLSSIDVLLIQCTIQLN